MRKVLGMIVLAIPFLAIFGFAWYRLGFGALCGILVISAAIVTFILVGVELMDGER